MADVKISELTAMTTPTDDDLCVVVDGSTTKKITWANIKATLKTYFDTLYNLYTHPTGDGNLHVPANSTTNEGKVLTAGAVAGTYTWENPAAGSGDVVGPATSTDNVIARYDGATGNLLQDALVTIDDNGSINIPTGETYDINGTPHTHAYGTGDMLSTNNLSDLANTATARTNLGLGDAAVADIGTGAGDVAAGDHTHPATGVSMGIVIALS